MIKTQKDIQEQLLKISKLRFIDETDAVILRKDFVKSKRDDFEKISATSAGYIRHCRSKMENFGIESFFSQYPLNTKEAQAVLSLAESLIRIEDSYTAHQLIHDKLAGANWSKKSETSYLMKLSSFAMQAAGKIVESGKIISSIADPVLHASIIKSIRMLGHNFITGETIPKALENSKKKIEKGFCYSYDMLGEGARTAKQAEDYKQKYSDAIDQLAKANKQTDDIFDSPSMSIKLSALHPVFEWSNRADVFEKLVPTLKELIKKAMNAGLSVTIDAEESRRLDLTLQVFEKIISDKDFKNFDGIGMAVQAYHKQAFAIIEFLEDLAIFNKKKISVRLVKGAYWDAEIKNAQVEGLKNYPVFTNKENTDLSYLACAYRLLEANDVIYPQFATHNATTIAEIEQATKGKKFEFQLLHGMGTSLYEKIVQNHKCRIYAPVGEYHDLLPYLIRRMLENSASTSFVRKLADKSLDATKLVEDALAKVRSKQEKFNTNIPMPEDIYAPSRKNSKGLDIHNYFAEKEFIENIKKFENKSWQSCSLISGKDVKGKAHNIFKPYNTSAKIGEYFVCNDSDIKKALDVNHKYFGTWSKTAAKNRAEILNKMADLLEENKYEAMAICMFEAGKTLPDCIAEVREAIDFCRFYAVEGIKNFAQPITLPGPTGETNQLSMHGRGVVFCVSPWNFPLAIFMGQIAAALMAGNTVIAKPAEPTSLIAYFAVKLLFKAGLPHDAISLIIGSGRQIGDILLPDNRIKAVTFTGSTNTANNINQALAARKNAIIPLIAETGGQNVMIVDSSALIEQTVDDVVISAFGSAGQRCSALRVLYVQEDIADKFIEVLSGATRQLNIGYPENIKNNMPSVINKQALEGLQNHVNKMQKSFKAISLNVPKDLSKNGYFIAPHIIQINSINDLDGEVFGPVLHIVRYKAKKIDSVIQEINDCGYGLTLGIQSRIETFAKYIKSRVAVGNIYVNRTMIGAVVGTQPFGGEGLSGTGPKAGGPNYLKRFATERTYTVNTTAIGGNAEILSEG